MDRCYSGGLHLHQEGTGYHRTYGYEDAFYRGIEPLYYFFVSTGIHTYVSDTLRDYKTHFKPEHMLMHYHISPRTYLLTSVT